MSALLEVRGLSVRRGRGAQTVAAVDDVDLEIGAGERVALVGESGCGKTSVALALLGLLPARSRQFRFQDVDLARASESQWRALRGRRIAMVFQDPQSALDPVLRVGRQGVSVLRRQLGVGAAAATETLRAAFESVELTPVDAVLDAYPHQLSGGQCQRAMLAIAMACEPELLVADEPTTALDVSTQARVLATLARLQRSAGTAVLMVTHDLAVVAENCDRAMVMYAGRIVEQGPVESLIRRPRHHYTAGLLAAVPRIEQGGSPARAIPGLPPRRPDQLTGCRFSPRCAAADDACRERPALTGSPQAFACHHPRPAGGSRDDR